MKVAWHEVPGNKRKADPSRRGTVDLLTSPRDIFRRTLPRALLETPDTPLEKFEFDDVRPDLRCNRSLLAAEKRPHCMHRTPVANRSFAIPERSDESRLMIRFLLIELLLRSPW